MLQIADAQIRAGDFEGALTSLREAFERLLAELERRTTPYLRLDTRVQQYDPSERQSPYSLVVNGVNRFSPSMPG